MGVTIRKPRGKKDFFVFINCRSPGVAILLNSGSQHKLTGFVKWSCRTGIVI